MLSDEVTSIPGGLQRRFHRWLVRLSANPAEWLPFAAIMVLTFVFFSPYLTGRITILPLDVIKLAAPWRVLGPVGPKNILLTDILTQFIPWRTLYREALLSGEFPFWDPFVFTGKPFAANFQSSAYYPFSLIFLIQPLTVSYLLYLMLHMALTGMGMQVFLRRIGLKPVPALTGSVVWMFAGFVTVWRLWLPHTSTLTWIPWVFAALVWRPGRAWWKYVPGLALPIALMILGGFPQFAYYGLLAAGAYAIWQFFFYQAPLIDRVRCLLGNGLGVLLGLMTSSVQWGTSLSLAGDIVRQSFSLSHLISGGLPLKHIITLIAPRYFGTVNTYWGVGNYVEMTGYIGLSSLVFFLFAPLNREFWRRKQGLFLVLMAFLALHLTYGGVLNWGMGVLPGYDSFRGLQRLYLIWSFAGAGVVAFGAQAIFDAQGWRRTAIWTLVVFLLGFCVIFLWQWNTWMSPLVSEEGWRAWLEDLLPARLALLIATSLVLILWELGRSWKQRWFLYLLPVLLITWDMVSFSRWFLPEAEPSAIYPKTELIEFLQAHKDEGRVAAFGGGFMGGILSPETASVFGIHQVDGDDPMLSSRYVRLIAAAEPARYNTAGQYGSLGAFESFTTLGSPILDLVGTRYLIAEHPLLDQDSISGAGWEEVYLAEDGVIYRNPESLPLALVVPSVDIVDSEDVQLELLANDGYNPKQVVILGEAPVSTQQFGAIGEVEIMERSFNRLRLLVEVQGDSDEYGFLLITQNHAAGWRAWVNGEPSRLYQADYAFHGLPLAQGRYEVFLQYRPQHWTIFLVCSILGLAGLIALSIFGRTKINPERSSDGLSQENDT